MQDTTSDYYNIRILIDEENEQNENEALLPPDTPNSETNYCSIAIDIMALISLIIWSIILMYLFFHKHE